MLRKLRSAHPQLFAWVCIFIGTGIMAIAYVDIYDPIGLVTGGFTGVAIILKSLTTDLMDGGIPLWVTNLSLNVPLFLLAFKVLGFRSVARSLWGTLSLSFWLAVIPPMDLSQGDYMLAALFGGVFIGGGIGLVFLGGATTGGTDLVAALLQKAMRHYSIAQVMQVVDALVVIGGLAVFGLRPCLYAIVAIYLTSLVSDAFLEGLKYSKAAFIITDQYQQVADRIMTELERGVTGLNAKGMYTGNEKCVLYCVVSKKEIVRVKDIAEQVDPNAFVIVSDAREVLGEGFQEYSPDA